MNRPWGTSSRRRPRWSHTTRTPAGPRPQHGLLPRPGGELELPLDDRVVADLGQQRRPRPASRPVPQDQPAGQIDVHDPVLGLHRHHGHAQHGVRRHEDVAGRSDLAAALAAAAELEPPAVDTEAAVLVLGDELLDRALRRVAARRWRSRRPRPGRTAGPATPSRPGGAAAPRPRPRGRTPRRRAPTPRPRHPGPTTASRCRQPRISLTASSNDFALASTTRPPPWTSRQASSSADQIAVYSRRSSEATTACSASTSSLRVTVTVRSSSTCPAKQRLTESSGGVERKDGRLGRRHRVHVVLTPHELLDDVRRVESPGPPGTPGSGRSERRRSAAPPRSRPPRWQLRRARPSRCRTPRIGHAELQARWPRHGRRCPPTTAVRPAGRPCPPSCASSAPASTVPRYAIVSSTPVSRRRSASTGEVQLGVASGIQHVEAHFDGATARRRSSGFSMSSLPISSPSSLCA